VTTREQLLAELMAERFGPPPIAELGRPLTEQLGGGGPDTPANIAHRRRVLLDADQERDPGTGKYAALKPAPEETE
jgi:hypothetical protein